MLKLEILRVHMNINLSLLVRQIITLRYCIIESPVLKFLSKFYRISWGISPRRKTSKILLVFLKLYEQMHLPVYIECIITLNLLQSTLSSPVISCNFHSYCLYYFNLLQMSSILSLNFGFIFLTNSAHSSSSLPILTKLTFPFYDIDFHYYIRTLPQNLVQILPTLVYNKKNKRISHKKLSIYSL